MVVFGGCLDGPLALGNAVLVARHGVEEALQAARRQNGKVSRGRGSGDTVCVFPAARHEDRFTGSFRHDLAIEPEFVLSGEQHEALVLPVVDVPGRAGAGWRKNLDNRNGPAAFLRAENGPVDDAEPFDAPASCVKCPVMGGLRSVPARYRPRYLGTSMPT
jgi:hypothetical protein